MLYQLDVILKILFQMNKFTHYKLWRFGGMILEGYQDQEPYKQGWEKLITEVEWCAFVFRREITEDQILVIKQGYEGFPYAKKTLKLVQFGAHKGSTYEDLSNDYCFWLSKQDWLEKWPDLNHYIKTKFKNMKDNAASSEDVKSILQTIQ